MIDWQVLFALFCAGVACCGTGGARVLVWSRHERVPGPPACAGSQSGDARRRKRASAAPKLTPETRRQLEEAFIAQEAAVGTTAGAGTTAGGRAPVLDLPPGVTLNDVLFPPFALRERLALFLGFERDRELGRRYRHATWLARRILDSCRASRLYTPGRPDALPEMTVFVPAGDQSDGDYEFCLSPPIGVRVTRFNNEFLEDLNARLSGLKAALTFRAPGVWIAVPPDRIAEKPPACSLADLGAPPESYRLPLPLGRSARGPVWVDLAAAPHALFAGATGSGKSTLIHACLHLLLDRAEVWGLDLKMVELSRYKRRMARLVTEPDEVTGLLGALFQETRRRLAAMQQQGYNAWRGAPIVLVVDELAEVTLASKDDTQLLLRLAQIGRAAGVHLLLATQRPSVQIIPGDLKANIPLRVALALPTGVDSRVVLDAEGAEKLAPPGDALVLQGHKITRVSTPNFTAPAPPLDLGDEEDPRLLGLSPDARAVFVRMQEARCRATVRAVVNHFRWGERRASRALRELRMAGLLVGEPEEESETATETNVYPPMLPVTAASVVDVVGVVGCENRGKNGQGVQSGGRGIHTGTLSGTPDTGSNSNEDQIKDAEDARVARQAIAAGLCSSSVRGLRRYFHWGQDRATRVLRVLRETGDGKR